MKFKEYLNEEYGLHESRSSGFIKSLGRGKVVSSKLDKDEGDGEIEILWKKIITV